MFRSGLVEMQMSVIKMFLIKEISFLLISGWSEGWSLSYQDRLRVLHVQHGQDFRETFFSLLIPDGEAHYKSLFFEKVIFWLSHQQCHFLLLWAQTAWRINPTQWHCSPAWSVHPQWSSTKIHWRTWDLDVHRLSGLFSLEAERKPGDHLSSIRQMQNSL